MKTFAALAICLWTAASAHSSTLTYFATLNGAGEAPPTGSGGTGSATVTIDTVANTMGIAVSFSGLGTGTTASHIHCCTTTPDTGTAIVATQLPTFIGFPLGVTSGTYTNSFDLTATATYSPTFLSNNGGTAAGAESALLSGLSAGEAYLNIHTTNFPGGEISGFLLVPTTTPEPGSAALFVSALGVLGLLGGVGRRAKRG